jgi:hypothetical protein
LYGKNAGVIQKEFSMSSSDSMSTSNSLEHFAKTIDLIRNDPSYANSDFFSKIYNVAKYISTTRRFEYEKRSLTNFDDFGRLMIWDPVRLRFIVVCGQIQAAEEGFLEDHDIK